MVRPPASSTLTLPNLIGVRVVDSPCVLRPDQLLRIAALLIESRPQDARAICFLGGPLADLSGARSGQQMVALEGDLGADPFLVIAGPQGAVALLAAEVPQGFAAWLLTAPEMIDRAALVLSQFSDHSYSLDAVSEPEAQRAFVATALAALTAAPDLAGVDLRALAPDERRWIDLAHACAAAPSPAGLLGMPVVQALLQEHGVARAVVGAFDAGVTQFHPLSASDVTTFPLLRSLPALLSGVARTRRGASVTASDAASLPGELALWVAGQALAVVPLTDHGACVGLLIAASARPLNSAGRAMLSGLSALLQPAILASAVADAPPELPQTRPAGSGMQGLAARLTAPTRPSGAPLPPRPTAPPTAPAAPPAAPAAPPAGDPARGGAGQIARRLMGAGKPSEYGHVDVAEFIHKLSDGVVVVDAQGRIVAQTQTAMRMLTLQSDARGKALVESGALCLAPLFTEAILGDLDAPREVELPTGYLATVEVVGVGEGLWAFVLHTDATQHAVSPAVAGAQLPSVHEGERSEAFLTNFSNIIRMPLRELRELITQVPAAGNLNEQQSRLIGQVVRLNSELTMLVNDLLALGQIRLQTSEARIPLRLDLLVEAAVGTQYAEFGRRGQHVTTEIQPGLPRIAGSEEGLGRAVGALIDNAIKYSPAGAQIKVSVAAQNDEVLVSVQDNGVGLLPEELAQVFDPFYRAPSTESLGVAGRGLGLTIAKAVIEQHGGRIWVTGAPGQGCAFSFSVPRE